jgi:hypothetical protein
MIWPAILLSISSYGWYLVFAYSTSMAYPNFGTGVLGLFSLGIIPVIVSFAANRRFLASGPTIFKVTLLNFLYYLLYASLTTLPGALAGSGFLFFALSPLSWAVYILPWTWQLFSWLLGTYFYYHSAEFSPAAPISNVKVAEISLGIMIPAIFLITFMGFSLPLPLTTIAFWFIAFTLALALAGEGITRISIVRPDIIFFHALVPSLAAIIIFFAAFSREIHLLLLTMQKTFMAFLMYIVNLLTWLLGKPTPADFEPPLNTSFGPLPEERALAEAAPLWVFLPFLVLALIKLLKTRLRPVTVCAGKAPSPLSAFRQIWKWFVVLIRNLLKLSCKLVEVITTMAGKVKTKLIRLLHRWLPARTPYQQILRSYEKFLRFGRKSGHPRKAFETPLEYALRLQDVSPKKPFPDVEIRQLTNLFMATYYSKMRADWPHAAESITLIKNILKKK